MVKLASEEKKAVSDSKKAVSDSLPLYLAAQSEVAKAKAFKPDGVSISLH